MDIVKETINLKEQHKETWRDKPESYWLARLMQEVGELGSSLVGDHDDPAEWELMQIAAICLNWLEMRNPKTLPRRSVKRVPTKCDHSMAENGNPICPGCLKWIG